jgi:hypothetical protein
MTSSDQAAAKRRCKEDTRWTDYNAKQHRPLDLSRDICLSFKLTQVAVSLITATEASHGAENRTQHGNKATRRRGTMELEGRSHLGPRPPRALPWVCQEHESAWVKGNQSNWVAPLNHQQILSLPQSQYVCVSHLHQQYLEQGSNLFQSLRCNKEAVADDWMLWLQSQINSQHPPRHFPLSLSQQTAKRVSTPVHMPGSFTMQGQRRDGWLGHIEQARSSVSCVELIGCKQLKCQPLWCQGLEPFSYTRW